MKDIIKEKYSKQAIVYNGIWMYFISTAKDVILDCKNNNIEITSLDAFKLTGEGIQPSQENSINFEVSENAWDKAIDFLSNIDDTSFVYEIWYDGY